MASVSIIIPIWNRAEYLPRLFHSLSSVTYEELEVVLVDNGSTDTSLSLCRSFAEEAPMVVTVLEEPRKGACCARNCGLRYCKTDWVYFFDSDDELTPTFLEEIMPQVGDEDMVAFPTKQSVKGVVRQRAFYPTYSSSGQILSLTLNTQSMLFRTSFLRYIGGWDESLGIWQDWELGVRVLLSTYSILWLGNKAYHTIYVHDDSITGPSLTSRISHICHAIDVVADEVYKESSLRALYFRCAILTGLLHREGDEEVTIDLPVAWPYRLLANLLRVYTAWGGRGAWRLAILFC